MTQTIDRSQNRVILFLRMIKFEHSIFALPFAYLGLLLGEQGLPDTRLFIFVTLAMVSFRTFAMGLNRLIDHTIDASNPRTAQRALPAKLLSRKEVWMWTMVSLAVFEWAAWQLGPLCLRLSGIPVLLAVIYPYGKRMTWACHFILGMVLGIAPYGAWIASRGSFAWAPGWISLGVIFWVAGFDMIYALQDESFDRDHRLHSFPARFGKETALFWTRVLHALTLVCWTFAGLAMHLGGLYFLGLGWAALFMLREHWLVRSFGLKKLDEAFFVMNAVVSVSVFAAAALDLFWRQR